MTWTAARRFFTSGALGIYEENGEFAEVFDLLTLVSNLLAIFFAAFFTTL
jgi:hypothetical protein